MSVTFLTGASSGLGEALAPRLARDGETVVLTARRRESLEALAARIRDEGGKALPIALDVGDHDAVIEAVRRVEREVGPVERMICNAGIGDAMRATDFRAAEVRRVYETNVFGVANCLEAVLPGMIERRRGHVVGVSSLAGYRGLPGSAAYASSKAAVSNMLEGLRIELAGFGVAVTTICPGFVKTPMTERNRHPMPFLMELDEAAELMHEAIRDRVTHCAFPWQLATVVRAGKLLPDALYDRALRKQRAQKA